MDELKKHKVVSDLYLISALSAYGVRAVRINRENPNRQKFIFDDETTFPVLVAGDNGTMTSAELTISEIETYFLADRLWFPGNYHKALKEVRANIHGYREDNY